MKNSLIELIHLNKTYPNKKVKRGKISALIDINLTIRKGEIFGIIGQSGAGKSSLIRCINLLEQPTSGEIILNGQSLTQLPLSKLRQMRHEIGMVFQHFNLLSCKTTFDNIALPLVLRGLDKKAIETKVNSLLELVELQDKRNAYPAQLSGGQKQRVGIARALASDPSLLLCDEATSALDAKTTESVLALLKKINQQFNLTILLITHQIEVVKTICDRVAVMDQGRIIEQADTVILFSKPLHTVTRALISSYLRQDLPQALRQHLTFEPKPNHHSLIQITFYGEVAAEPIVTRLIQQLDVAINIIQANLEYIREQPIGRMVIEIMGESHQLQRVLDFLHHYKLKTEIIGYVPTHVD